jgi:hypothetical protein
MSGYWSTEDAEAWRQAAVTTMTAAPRDGGWYMLGDYADSRPQTDEVNAIRDEVSKLQINRGVVAFVVYGLGTVASMQLKRLVAERSQQSRFVFTSDRPAALQELRARLEGE